MISYCIYVSKDLYEWQEKKKQKATVVINTKTIKKITQFFQSPIHPMGGLHWAVNGRVKLQFFHCTEKVPGIIQIWAYKYFGGYTTESSKVISETNGSERVRKGTAKTDKNDAKILRWGLEEATHLVTLKWSYDYSYEWAECSYFAIRFM